MICSLSFRLFIVQSWMEEWSILIVKHRRFGGHDWAGCTLWQRVFHKLLQLWRWHGPDSTQGNLKAFLRRSGWTSPYNLQDKTPCLGDPCSAIGFPDHQLLITNYLNVVACTPPALHPIFNYKLQFCVPHKLELNRLPHSSGSLVVWR